MMKEVIATGRTVDAAIDSGCAELGLERGDVDFEIISMPKKGFLGLSQIPAKVRVFVEVPDPKPAPEQKPAPREEKPLPREEKPAPRPAAPKAQPVREPVREEEPKTEEKQPQAGPVRPEQEAPAEPAAPCDFGNKIAVAEEYVTSILRAMNLSDVTIAASTHENVIQIRLSGDVSGVAIGRHGETLDALQYLAGLAANCGEGDYVRVVLDSGNYRDKRRATLEQLARRLGSAVLRTGRSTTLEPMNPYERRIIHSTISQMEGITSASTGEEPNRCVVISSNNPSAAPARDARPPRSGRPPRRDGGRPPRRDGDRPRGPRSGFGGRDGRRNERREKPAPYQESSRREVPPTEAENQPLYGKIEI